MSIICDFARHQKLSWQFQALKDVTNGLKGGDLLSKGYFEDLNIAQKKHCPECLYKFYAPTVENLSDVQNRLLWLASPQSFNDPYDCKLTYNCDEYLLYSLVRSLSGVNEFTAEEKKKIFQYVNFRPASCRPFYDLFISETFPNKCEIIRHNQYLETCRINEYIDNRLDNLFRIACFSAYSWDSKNYDQLMWAHYAQSHRGFCVVYDISPIYEDDIDLKSILPHYCESMYKGPSLCISSYEQLNLLRNGFFPVYYSSKPVLLSKSTCYAIVNETITKRQKNDIDIKFMRAMLTKMLPWQYEKEYRLIVNEEVAKQVNYKIPFPFAKRIIIGTNASSELCRLLRGVAKQLSIDVSYEYV